MKLPTIVRRYARETAYVASGCLLGYLLGISGGKWVSTGNGRTIINTRTGEVRSSFTGEPIVENSTSRLEVEERDRLRRAAAKGEASLDRTLAQFQERRRELDLPPLIISNDDRALWLLDAPEDVTLEEFQRDEFGGVVVETPNGDTAGRIQAEAANEAKGRAERNALRARLRSLDDAALARQPAELKGDGDVQASQIAAAMTAHRTYLARKAEIFKELQTFADQQFDGSYGSPFVQQSWRDATQPLRIGDSLTDEEAKRLLDALGRITGLAKYRADEGFKRAIKLVREYESHVETGSVDMWQIFDEAPEIGVSKPWDNDPIVFGPAGETNQGQMTVEEFMALDRDQDGDDKEPTRD